jgi:alkylation response protein AidB-like acyl-CoA dehydrogenase
VDDFATALDAWLDQNWDPELTIGEWWERLASSGWAVPTWPTKWLGLGASRAAAGAVRDGLARRGLPGPPAGLGITLAGPTILDHGDDRQCERFLPDIVAGRSNWCQLFSEPGAGSDLASVRTRAESRDGRWHIDGQKVWTSNAHLANRGMLLARTEPGTSGREGLSWLAIQMSQPGIELRPLREMTGRALFYEVYLDGATAELDDIVGGEGNGWAVARTTLANERGGLSTGGVGLAPGPAAAAMDLRAGDIAARVRTSRRSTGTSMAMRGKIYDTVHALAAENGRASEPVMRDRLARLLTLERISAWLPATRSARGRSSGGEASLAKLHHSRTVQLGRDVALSVAGSHGMLSGHDGVLDGRIVELALFSPAVSIYGGTDQIQRNVLAERELGLPRTTVAP